MTSTVVFLHSTGLGPFMWTPYQSLAGDAKVLTPFNRGYGPGDEVARPEQVRVAEDVAALAGPLSEIPGGVHLVGHSYGGLLALELARLAPDRVKSLYLYEPVVFAALRERAHEIDPAAASDVRELYGDNSFFDDDVNGGDEAWLQRFIDYWNGPGAWLAMGERARAAMRRVGWKMHLEVKSVSVDAQPFEAYRLSQPVTVVAGEKSPATAREMARLLAAELPQASLRTLPGVSHMSVLDRPDVVGPSLAEHFRRVLGA